MTHVGQTKKEACKFFRSRTGCKRGAQCHFAHITDDDIVAKREQARQEELQRKREEAALQKAVQHAELQLIVPDSRHPWDRRKGV
eukprot:CAMPEP_0119390724 /NCGR_PEP_ID=MMETSP1334-20130426/114476_1 /TAXON_ID=127549 /ORGANISM="Calcidiscus leptoporus, Strain RCC1130" /LENGTH=84 /DNA_ID=CAMNT_0007413285 /DNA_START=15 /DNA_END=269 /DNA_ORIENTATION=+